MLHSQSVDSYYFTDGSFQLEMEGLAVRVGEVVGGVVMSKSILVRSKTLCIPKRNSRCTFSFFPRLSTLAPAATDSPDCRPHVIANWLSSLDFRERLADFLERRTEGTGEWLLQSQPFRDWLGGKSRILWCSGIRELSFPNYSTVPNPIIFDNSWCWKDIPRVSL